MHYIDVQYLCNKKGLTFSALAEKVGYSRSGLHRAITMGTINIATLKKIAKVLDVAPSHFLGGGSKEGDVVLSMRVARLENLLFRAWKIITLTNTQYVSLGLLLNKIRDSLDKNDLGLLKEHFLKMNESLSVIYNYPDFVKLFLEIDGVLVSSDNISSKNRSVLKKKVTFVDLPIETLNDLKSLYQENKGEDRESVEK